MGVSDRHYFAWLRDALDQAESATGLLAGMRAQGGPRMVWVMAGARTNPGVDFVVDALGRAGARVVYLDRYDAGPGVIAADFNALDSLPDNACDVLIMTRASYMTEDATRFLGGARRLLRPGGAAIVDWVHGAMGAPVLDLPGSHVYGGREHEFRTTYVDPLFLTECARDFESFIADVNRPPWWVDPAAPNRPPDFRRLRRLWAPRIRRSITPATYIDALRADLAQAGKSLVEPAVLEEFFKVAFRAARYFRPLTGKFYLHLLTVLRPVGK